ncbi:MAG: glycosyltransferase, partial [Verrucomicrobiota bacterium]
YFDPDLCQFLHIAGSSDVDSVKEAYKSASVTAHVLPFLGEMEWAYAASDLTVCRSGASSLTEMSVVGLPGILVPYPYAADDHQNRNAEIFEEKEACIVIQQADLKPLELAELVANLGSDSSRLEQMAQSLRSLAPHNPADAICDLIENKTS